MKQLLFEIKNLYKSVWSIALYVPTSLICAAVLLMSGQSAASFLRNTFYLDMFLSVFIPVLAIYKAQNIYDFEFSIKPKSTVYLTKMLSIVFFLLPIVLINVLYVLLPLHSQISFSLQLDYIGYVFAALGTKILFFTVLGFSLGRASLKKSIYAVSFFIAVIVSPFFQNFLFSAIFSGSRNPIALELMNLLNISFDEPFKFHSLSFGFLGNRLLVADLLFYIAITGLLLSVLLLKKRGEIKRNIINSACILVCLAVITSVSVYLVKNYPTAYSCNELLSTEAAPKKFALTGSEFVKGVDPFFIESYSMEINLKKSFSNRCTVRVFNEAQGLPVKSIDFKLDSCFTVAKAAVDGKDVACERSGEEYICVSLPENTAKPYFTVELQYYGDVNYMNLIFIRNAFVDNNAAYLPETFAWYPRLDKRNGETWFSLQITAGNTIVSNLTNNAAIVCNGQCTIEAASSSEVYLLCGFYKTETVDGRQITCFEDYLGAKRELIDKILDAQEKGVRAPFDAPFEDGKHEMRQIDPITVSEKSIVILPFSYASSYSEYCLDDCILITESFLY